MTIRHLVVIEETFRSDCATDKIPTTFETKAPNLQARAFQSIDAQTTDIDEVTSSTTYIIALVKAIETLNLCKLADVDNRDRHEHSRRDSVAPFELSCFWCGGKDHTLFECSEPPPNAKTKAALDMVAVVKVDKSVRVVGWNGPANLTTFVFK